MTLVLSLLREWSGNEDERWSFLRNYIKHLGTEVSESQEVKKAPPQDEELIDSVAGLRERLSLLEMTFSTHEQSMELLKTNLIKNSETVISSLSLEKKIV